MTIILIIIITVILITILTITIIIMTIMEKIKDEMAEVVPEVTRDSFKLNADKIGKGFLSKEKLEFIRS